ncbi:MAG: pyruvate, water dikinase [Patescibacteria group bacterium]|nr:pyruvate, water dikinase [Patescibacteria group bacterium]
MFKTPNEEDLKPYKVNDWINVQKANWSFLVCTDFISCYTTDIEIDGINPFNHPIFVCSPGKSELWFLKSELDSFGSRIKHINTGEKIDNLCEDVRSAGEELLDFISDHNNEVFDAKLYKGLWEKIRSYYKYHLIAKYLGDYISSEILYENLNKLKEARVKYAEPIGKSIYELFNKVILDLSFSTSLNPEVVACLTKDELYDYFNNGNIPHISILEDRYKKSIIIGWVDGYNFVTNEDANNLEVFLQNIDFKNTKEIKGSVAFKGGVVKGVAKIIRDPRKPNDFNDGDILVTGMTHVDYLPLVKKSSAIVTDAGGVLSHAAIIARELSKPCVIGTTNATNIIKDGDEVEVDTINGVVRIL